MSAILISISVIKEKGKAEHLWTTLHSILTTLKHSDWGGKHLIAAHYSFIDRPPAEVHPSAEGRACDRESSMAKTDVLATVPRHRPIHPTVCPNAMEYLACNVSSWPIKTIPLNVHYLIDFPSNKNKTHYYTSESNKLWLGVLILFCLTLVHDYKIRETVQF